MKQLLFVVVLQVFLIEGLRWTSEKVHLPSRNSTVALKHDLGALLNRWQAKAACSDLGAGFQLLGTTPFTEELYLLLRNHSLRYEEHMRHFPPAGE